MPGKSPLGKRSAGTAEKAPDQPQIDPIWEHTDSGWWVIEQNGMLRTGPFKDKEQARGWFYKELDIKLSI